MHSENMHSERPLAGAPETAEWRGCRGEVRHLVHGLRWRRRSSRLRHAALLAIFGAIAVFGDAFYPAVAAKIAFKMAGSECDHYQMEMRAFYCDRSRGELEVDLWQHLSKCPDCRKDFDLCSCIGHTPHVRGPVRPQNRAKLDSHHQPVALQQLRGSDFEQPFAEGRDSQRFPQRAAFELFLHRTTLAAGR